LQGALDDVEQRALARLVPLGAGQAALLGPAAVPVHDDRDVLGHQRLGQLRRARPARVRRRGGVTATGTGREKAHWASSRDGGPRWLGCRMPERPSVPEGAAPPEPGGSAGAPGGRSPSGPRRRRTGAAARGLGAVLARYRTRWPPPPLRAAAPPLGPAPSHALRPEGSGASAGSALRGDGRGAAEEAGGGGLSPRSPPPRARRGRGHRRGGGAAPGGGGGPPPPPRGLAPA